MKTIRFKRTSADLSHTVATDFFDGSALLDACTQGFEAKTTTGMKVRIGFGNPGTWDDSNGITVTLPDGEILTEKANHIWIGN